MFQPSVEVRNNANVDEGDCQGEDVSQPAGFCLTVPPVEPPWIWDSEGKHAVWKDFVYVPPACHPDDPANYQGHALAEVLRKHTTERHDDAIAEAQLAGESPQEALGLLGPVAVGPLSGPWMRGWIRRLEKYQDYSNYEYGFILAPGQQFYFKREWFREHWPPKQWEDVVFRWAQKPGDDLLPIAFDIWHHSRMLEEEWDLVSTWWADPILGFNPTPESASVGAAGAGSSGSTRPTKGEDCLNTMPPLSIWSDDEYALTKRGEGAEQSQGKPFGTHGEGKGTGKVYRILG